MAQSLRAGGGLAFADGWSAGSMCDLGGREEPIKVGHPDQAAPADADGSEHPCAHPAPDGGGRHAHASSGIGDAECEGWRGLPVCRFHDGSVPCGEYG